VIAIAVSQPQAGELTPAEREDVLRVVVACAGFPKTAARRRKTFLIVTGAGAIFLAAWIVTLAFTLPSHSTAHHWRLAWIGFDVAEATAMGVACLAAFWARWLVVPASLVVGTLLFCDAWFDVVLSSGSSDWFLSLLLAVLVEIPLAIFFWRVALKLGLLNLVAQRSVLGLTGAPPRLRQRALLAPLSARELAAEKHHLEVPPRLEVDAAGAPRSVDLSSGERRA
jgi:hypothetical protein